VSRALASLPAHEWDAWLLNRFPGRTLEELDAVDIPRLLRAVRVQEIDRVESTRRLAVRAGSQSKLESSDWRAIQRHDRLIARHYGESERDGE